MFTPKGKFGWYELMTSDTKAAGKFYSDVVGWTTQEMPSTDGSSYTTFNVGNVGLAGMLNIPGHTAWVGYISVDDVDAHIEKIVEAGGKLWKPATDIPGMLRFAVMSDPQGAAIVVFTPDPKGNCRYLVLKSDQVLRVEAVIETLASEPPPRTSLSAGVQRVAF